MTPNPCRRRGLLVLYAVFCLLTARSASAIIIVNGANGRNLQAPIGIYAGSGWQYLGDWGGVLGTPVSPHFFLSAKHAGFPGDGLLHTGTGAYTVIDAFYDVGSDLALYQIAETFPDFAPLYTGSDETTLGEAVLYGRGVERGDPLFVNGTQQGWYWGDADFPRSWGTNAVSEIVDFGPGLGDLLLFTTDKDAGGENEGAVSGWDSGGPVYVRDNGVWKLAGINYGVETYSLDGVSGVRATVWDKRGLYVSNGSGYDFVSSSLTTPQPGIFGATRVSSRYESFLLPIIRADLASAAPEPGTFALLLPILSGALGLCRWRRA